MGQCVALPADTVRGSTRKRSGGKRGWDGDAYAHDIKKSTTFSEKYGVPETDKPSLYMMKKADPGNNSNKLQSPVFRSLPPIGVVPDKEDAFSLGRESRGSDFSSSNDASTLFHSLPRASDPPPHLSNSRNAIYTPNDKLPSPPHFMLSRSANYALNNNRPNTTIRDNPYLPVRSATMPYRSAPLRPQLPCLEGDCDSGPEDADNNKRIGQSPVGVREQEPTASSGNSAPECADEIGSQKGRPPWEKEEEGEEGSDGGSHAGKDGPDGEPNIWAFKAAFKQQIWGVLSNKQRQFKEIIRQAPRVSQGDQHQPSEDSSVVKPVRPPSPPRSPSPEFELEEPRPSLPEMKMRGTSRGVTKVAAETLEDMSVPANTDSDQPTAHAFNMPGSSTGGSAYSGLGLVSTINEDDIIKRDELGRGQFARVYRCKWRGVEVAVKEWFGLDTPSNMAEMQQEADTLAVLRHPCVISIYGTATIACSPATVSEFVVHGSLKDKLIKLRETENISTLFKVMIALQAAYGMDFLHRRNVIHFDLKSANLLCDLRDETRPVVKVADMGLSKSKLETFVSGNMRGTLPWMAPEMFPSMDRQPMFGSIADRVNEKVDVYSFGIVLWEIWTLGKDPYEGLSTADVLMGVMASSRLRPQIPSNCEHFWVELMERCWKQDPLDRPSFSEIVSVLENFADQHEMEMGLLV